MKEEGESGETALVETEGDIKEKFEDLMESAKANDGKGNYHAAAMDYMNAARLLVGMLNIRSLC